MRDVVFCNQCGHRNNAEEMACRTCGELLVPQQPATQPIPAVVVDGASSLYSRPPDGAYLVVRTGNVSGAQFWVSDGKYVVGRDEASDIFLDDVTVSRRHAEIIASQDSYVVRDLGSLNGTYVNGTRVEQTVLHHGDELQLGRFRLTFLAAA